MKKRMDLWDAVFYVFWVAVMVGIVWSHIPSVHAQNPTLTPYQFGVNNVTHASCTVVASTTQYCYASDGPWVSINGAAYVSMMPSTSAQLTATAPLAISNNNITLGTTGLKTIIDGLGLQAAAAPVQ